MLQIRKGVFETNSSSIHSICISRRNLDWKYELPKSLVFRHGEYGWAENTYHDTQNKANYLYQAICDLFEGKEKYKMITYIADVLIKYGVFTEFESDKKDEYGLYIGGIDHAGDLRDFVYSVCSREKKLLRYLFSDESFIITGNDNRDIYIPISVDYKHDEYHKGN